MAASGNSSEEIIAEIKERSDIVQIIGEHVNLKRSGVRYLGICPFHHEKTPSFSVHSGQQFYHCFGCKESGDVFSFMMKYHNLDFRGALKVLAQRYQITLPERKKSKQQRELEQQRERLFKVNEKAAAIFSNCLTDSEIGKNARNYLEQRGIGRTLQERYQLGFAPSVEAVGWNYLGSKLDRRERDLAVEVGLLAKKQQQGTYDRFRNRIIFPIADSRGRVAGFGGRVLGDENPKYLNSPESSIYNKSRLLFGFFQQRDAIRKQRRAVLVEGNFDLLSLVSYGIESAVAPLGTALTREQVRKLKPLVDEVILLFDGDEAGLKAVERSMSLFLAEQVSGRVVVLPAQHDPDTFLKENGAESLLRAIEQAETLPEFYADRLVARYGLTLDGKAKIVQEFRPLIGAASSRLQRSMWAAHFAKILGIDPEDILTEAISSNSTGQWQGELQSAPSRQEKQSTPLTGGLKDVVTFMVMHPEHYQELSLEGVETALSGTIAEILYIQMKMLSEQKAGNWQPEDLLTVLPEGEERSLVAEILIQATEYEKTHPSRDRVDEELEEVLEWVKTFRLQQESDRLITAINDAQKNKDFSKVTELLQQKMNIDAVLKNRE